MHDTPFPGGPCERGQVDFSRRCPQRTPAAALQGFSLVTQQDKAVASENRGTSFLSARPGKLGQQSRTKLDDIEVKWSQRQPDSTCFLMVSMGEGGVCRYPLHHSKTTLFAHH